MLCSAMRYKKVFPQKIIISCIDCDIVRKAHVTGKLTGHIRHSKFHKHTQSQHWHCVTASTEQNKVSSSKNKFYIILSW